MKLVHLSIAFITAVLLALSINAWMLVGIQTQQAEVERVMHTRKASVDLTTKIESDVHQLSQLVRAYTSTGDSKYLRYYYDLIAIRKGVQPEPEDYTNQYWYQVMSGEREHQFDRPANNSKPILQQLFKYDFSAQEIRYLEQILNISDQMAQTEKIAFAATQGLYDPTTEHFIDDGEPQLTFAIGLVNSPAYLQLNNQLLQQVKQLINETDLRTKHLVVSAQKAVRQATEYAMITVVISVLLLLAMGYVVFLRILSPLKKLLQASNDLQHNQYDTRAHIGKSVQEITQIARNVNEMAASIEADIMHRTNMEQDIREEKRKTEEVHQQLQESIRSAAQIQHTLPASDEVLNQFFHEQFHIWKPKDVVGGDIYLFSTLRHEGEGILMIIDCTGHGVPGAFLTMLAQAIYQQIIANLIHRQGEISPAKLLAEFNIMLKKLLKQDGDRKSPADKQSYHDVGLDAGIVYCDKQRNLVRFAGAHTPLFYLNGTDLNVIKGERHSLGYRSSRANLKFNDYDVIATPFTTFYLTTDGYLDQNGGEKGLPFGKKRFEKTVSEQGQQSLVQQKNNFLKGLQDYQKDNHQTDDITLLAFRL